MIDRIPIYVAKHRTNHSNLVRLYPSSIEKKKKGGRNGGWYPRLRTTYPEYVKEEVAGSRPARSGTAQPAQARKEPLVPVLVVLVLHLVEGREGRNRFRATLLVRELHFDLVLLRLGRLLHLVRSVLRFRVHVLPETEHQAFNSSESNAWKNDRSIVIELDEFPKTALRSAGDIVHSFGSMTIEQKKKKQKHSLRFHSWRRSVRRAYSRCLVIGTRIDCDF